MSNYERKEFKQIRLEWVCNGVSGNGDWFDWSTKIEASLQAHLKENHNPAKGQSMRIGVRSVVEFVPEKL